MNKIVYSSNIVPSRNKRYIGIPSRAIKIVLTYEENIELNHFERVILSLLCHKFYTIEELADATLLDKTLVDFIIYNLIKKGYLDKKYHVSEKGEKALANLHKEKTSKEAYVFYDMLRGKLFNHVCTNDEFKVIECNGKSFDLSNEAINEYIQFTKIEGPYSQLNQQKLDKQLDDLFYLSGDKNLVNKDIVEIDASKYFLITYLGYDDEEENKNFMFGNPFTLENDDELYFFYSQYKNDALKNLILELTKSNLDDKRLSDEKDKKINEFIQNNLFNKKISLDHIGLILPLNNVLKAYSDVEEAKYGDFISGISNTRYSLLNLADLMEEILYLTARAYNDNSKCLNSLSNKGIIENELTSICRRLGFEINEKTKKLFILTKRDIIRQSKNPSKKVLSSVIAWNLAIAYENPQHYFWKLAKIHPEYINNMYYFKRNTRDVVRHGIVKVKKKSEYLDMMFEILELGLGYKVNQNSIKRIANMDLEDKTTSYAEEYLKQTINPKFFNSNENETTNMKNVLLALVGSLANEEAKYISQCYSILDSTYKKLLNYLKDKYKITYDKIKNQLENQDDALNLVQILGFITKPLTDIECSLREMLIIDKSIERSFNENFKNAVLSGELYDLVLMIKTNLDVKNELIKFKELFILPTMVAKLYKHNLTYDFNEKHAQLLVDLTIDFINKFDYLFK